MVFTLKCGFCPTDHALDAPPSRIESAHTGAGVGLLGLGWLLDLGCRFFGRVEYTARRAWTILAASVVVIGVACGGIAWAVEASAEALGVRPYFTAVILAAAATSVPDTILSMKDAYRGEYDDALANAVGSNIFDITICLGVPLLAYGLVVGDLTLEHTVAAADVQVLTWMLLFVTLLVIAMFVVRRQLGSGTALALLGVFAVWTAFIVGRATEARWTEPIIHALPGHSLPSPTEVSKP
jgi:cation:H+ antiporter